MSLQKSDKKCHYLGKKRHSVLWRLRGDLLGWDFLGRDTRNVIKEKTFLYIKVTRNVIISPGKDNLYCKRHSGKDYLFQTMTKWFVVTIWAHCPTPEQSSRLSSWCHPPNVLKSKGKKANTSDISYVHLCLATSSMSGYMFYGWLHFLCLGLCSMYGYMFYV